MGTENMTPKKKEMRIEFLKQKNVFEFIPCITWYHCRGGEYSKGSLTFAWLFWAIKIYKITRS